MTDNKSQQLIDKLDESVRTNIIELEKQLGAMQVEIATQIQNIASYTGDNPLQHQEHLSSVAKEMNFVLKEIQNIASMEMDLGEAATPVLQGVVAQKINEIVLTSITELNRLKERIKTRPDKN